MVKIISYFLIGIIIAGVIAVIIPTIKYYKDKKVEKLEWQSFKANRVRDFGAVKELTILPLIDYYTGDEELIGESGVSYLIKADGKNILFDVGFNMKSEHPSPLLMNMNKLNVELEEIDSIFISHLHPDHVGGMEAKKNMTFALSGEDIGLEGKMAYVPIDMVHSTADIDVIENLTKIAEGIISIGNISRAIWGMGLTQEQGLAINVEGKGIVLVVGCGHQTTEKIIERVENIFDEPIYGIIGGLHYPVTKREDRVFNIRRIIGTGKLPWENISKKEVDDTIELIREKDIKIIGISPHDSCDWTINEFKNSFSTRYQDILVGKPIIF